jgi:hypothetical protein
MPELPRQSNVTGEQLVTAAMHFTVIESAEDAGLVEGAIKGLLESDLYGGALTEARIMCGDDREALGNAMTLFGVAVGVMAARGTVSSEPVFIPVADGDVWVARFTGPEDEPCIQLDVAGGQEHATASLTLDDAAEVAGELLQARQAWLSRAASRARRATGPGTPGNAE